MAEQVLQRLAEPVKKGRAISIKARLLIANWDTDSYAAYGARTIAIQFRTPNGSCSTVKTAKTATNGWLSTTVTAKQTGCGASSTAATARGLCGGRGRRRQGRPLIHPHHNRTAATDREVRGRRSVVMRMP